MPIIKDECQWLKAPRDKSKLKLLKLESPLPNQTIPSHFVQSYVLYSLCLRWGVRITLGPIFSLGATYSCRNELAPLCSWLALPAAGCSWWFSRTEALTRCPASNSPLRRSSAWSPRPTAKPLTAPLRRRKIAEITFLWLNAEAWMDVHLTQQSIDKVWAFYQSLASSRIFLKSSREGVAIGKGKTWPWDVIQGMFYPWTLND